LLVLDLQNEMTDPSGKVGRHGLAGVVDERGVLANMKTAIDAVRSRGDRIVFVRLGFRPDYADALSVASRIARLEQDGAAVLGTWGCEFPASIAPRDDELIVTKQCKSVLQYGSDELDSAP
jgi:nicotinamidase-related amidase